MKAVITGRQRRESKRILFIYLLKIYLFIKNLLIKNIKNIIKGDRGYQKATTLKTRNRGVGQRMFPQLIIGGSFFRHKIRIIKNYYKNYENKKN